MCILVPFIISLKRWELLVKKTQRYKERKHSQRILYLQKLREYIKINGSKNLIYTDESGFSENVYNPHAWSKRGDKIYGEKHGKRSKRTIVLLIKNKTKLILPEFDFYYHTIFSFLMFQSFARLD